MTEPALSEEDIVQIVHGAHPDPFAVLGPHRAPDGGWVVRAFLPQTREVALVPGDGGEPRPMTRLHPGGFFVADVRTEELPYRLRPGEELEIEDPYAFGSGLGELDLHLLGEGTHRRLFRTLGAHPLEMGEVAGIRFAVWAPNARRVSVVGDFNDWDGRRHPMRFHPGAGVWEIFLPGVETGALYKYEILPQHGPPFNKSDPVALRSELRPATASVVERLGGFEWSDGEWMRSRLDGDAAAGPISIYEVHPGSWRRHPEGRPLNYRELADELGDYVERLGFTHVEFLPVMEHPYDPSWGYQVTGYFAVTSRFGSPDDFRYLVDHLHRRGIGVILDWVPGHFPKDAAGLRRFDGTALFEHEDPRQGEQPDWGTMVFNFGRAEVRNFLIANALFWLEEFHVDGLRVDAVASMLYLDYSREEGAWVPNVHGGRENLEAIHFLRELNGVVRHEHPGALMIAEESTAWPGVTRPPEEGGLGFHLKWNMGWMNDFLRFMAEDPLHRRHHFNLITFSLMYAFSERFVLPLSHDEVVHGKRSLLHKMPGDDWRRFANLRLALGFMWGHPGKKLLFMGAELGQREEWSEGRALPWELLEHDSHAGLQRWVADLCALYRGESALWAGDDSPEGWEWIDFEDTDNSVVAFLRKGGGGAPLVWVCNLTPEPRPGYRIGVPDGGRYRELLNSDAPRYWGSGVVNAHLHAEEESQHGRPFSLELTLPPLGVLVLRHDGGDGEQPSGGRGGRAGSSKTQPRGE